MTVNKEAFKAVYELINNFPELHNQSDWEAVHSCGTTRCVAGWATWWKATQMELLSEKHRPTDEHIRFAIALDLKLDYSDYDSLGQAILGLSNEDALSLFHDFNNYRVLARVESFARKGRDLQGEEWDPYE